MLPILKQMRCFLPSIPPFKTWPMKKSSKIGYQRPFLTAPFICDFRFLNLVKKLHLEIIIQQKINCKKSTVEKLTKWFKRKKAILLLSHVSRMSGETWHLYRTIFTIWSFTLFWKHNKSSQQFIFSMELKIVLITIVLILSEQINSGLSMLFFK